MSKPTGAFRARVDRMVVGVAITLGCCCQPSFARNYLFENITDLPTAPGSGRGAEINDRGDIAFLNNGAVWLYSRSAGTFLNVTALPGAPLNPFFVHLNNVGNLAMVETPTSTRDFWFFEASTQSFTNISQLPNFPGNSQASFGWTAFDLNDNNKMSFHSGDNNFGDVYVYDHATGAFEKITDKPGGRPNGRENELNNLDQVLYMGFPSAYLYDPLTGNTTNINDLPGGPGMAITNLDLNDQGDVALTSANVSQFYNATTGEFVDLTTIPGWQPDITSSSRSDLSNSQEITFWREGLFAFDTQTLRFSQLNGFPGSPPLGGLETRLNSSGQVALNGFNDVFLATPRPYGDYDNDGDVDANDLAQFEATFSNAVAIGTAADGDSNRLIGGGDFLVWQQHNGSDQPLVQGLYQDELGRNVPEPGSQCLLVLTFMEILGCRRRDEFLHRATDSFRLYHRLAVRTKRGTSPGAA